jgi:hypothetical protein
MVLEQEASNANIHDLLKDKNKLQHTHIPHLPPKSALSTPEGGCHYY